MPTLNFRFNSHPPYPPYGHVNLTDYTNTKAGVSSGLALANLKLPLEGRHCHILYWPYRLTSEFICTPRLLFRINEFDMISFRDGCHTGGIFIGEKSRTIASYCSKAGKTFLNGTSERGGILFGISRLIIILKGYSWFCKHPIREKYPSRTITA